MSEGVWSDLASYIKEYTGLCSPASNQTHLKRVLTRQAAAAGMDLAEYFLFMQADESITRRFLDDIMIGETYFFREVAQFRLLQEHIIPELFGLSSELRCWSMSCSTGEEPVSLAVLLEDYRRTHPGTSYRVYASDLNERSLKRLRSGIFPASSLRRDGAEFHSYLCEKYGVRREDASLEISKALRSRIDVHRLNFYRDDLDPVPDELDLVFFRNTLLYSDEKERKEIIERVVRKLRHGAYFFLAGTEVPFVQHPELSLRSINRVYFLQKRAASSVVKSESRNAEVLSVAQEKLAGSDSRVRPNAAHMLRTEDLLQSARICKVPQSDSPTQSYQENAAEDVVEHAGRVVRELQERLNAGDHDGVVRRITELETAAPRSALSTFFRGRLAFVQGELETAVKHLLEVIDQEPEFWPARYYCVLVQRTQLGEASKKSGVERRDRKWLHGELLRQLRRCIASLDRGQSDATDPRSYTVLLDDFNIAYFRRMCVHMIAELNEEDPCL